jgi:hypothetical protein
MRSRDRVLASLESTYREAFARAEAKEDQDEMARLDFEFQRDQVRLEILLDIRDLLAPREAPPAGETSSLLKEGSALIQKAGKLRRITRLR